MQLNRSYRTSRRITYALFVAPALILFVLVVIFPFFQGIPYSMTNWNLISNAADYVGFKNYRALMNSKEFWTVIKNTFQFTLYYIVFSNLVGLMVALLLQRPGRINNLSRTLVFMPYVISLLTAAFVWRYIFNSVYTPLFNQPSPLGVKSQAMLGVAVISVWRTSGYCMLIYIAALQGVPQEYYEAASIEGAGAWQKFRRITMPMILPAFSSNVSMLLAWGLKVFESIRASTNGGPTRNATTSISMFIYNSIFANGKAGYGQAAAIVMTAIMLILSFLVSRFFRSREVY